LRTGVRPILIAVVLALLTPAAAVADVRIDGHGFGHGAGLAQYGAFGYARQEGRDFRWILDHYYPGTRLAAAPRARLRVRLKEAVALRVTSAASVRGANGRRLALSSRRTYRFAPWRADQLRVIDLASGRTRAHLLAPARVSPGGSPLKLIGKAENGVTDGRYRGALVLARSAGNVLAIDDVDLEQYLYGVVPSEMPASWPAAALSAQAVAARSYALRSRRPTQPFDVFADTRSQQYGGVGAESATTTAAVRATRALAVMIGADVAQTLFHSSSGGRTAAVQEVFDSPPLPYLVSVDDPYDTLSPYHDWSVALTEREVAQKLAELVPGEFADLAVVATTPSGRAATVRITGSAGTRDVPASTVRTRLGLRSTWFTITRD
jgi:stage II sporulation protein D